MTRWEYQLTELKEPVQRPGVGILNEYGRDGWEIYAVTRVSKTDGHRDYVGHLSFHMRRPLPSCTVPAPAGGQGE